MNRGALVQLLFTDYNVFRSRTAHQHQLTRDKPFLGRWLSPKPERLEVLGRMVDWCAEQQLEPRLWLLYLFRRRSWRFAPKLAVGDLCSVTMRAGYKPQYHLSFFRAHTQANALTQVEAYDPNRDLDHGTEVLKSQLQPQDCLDGQLERTLGFHPGSAVCRRCPLAAECVVRLEALAPFSFVALRRGALSRERAALIVKGWRPW